MFRGFFELEHEKAKTKQGEEPRKADAAGTDAKARRKSAPEMRQGHGEECPFQAVFESVQAAEGEPPFHAVLHAIDAVKTAVEHVAMETPETGRKSRAENGSGPNMRSAATV
jgi:hypothetical protein